MSIAGSVSEWVVVGAGPAGIAAVGQLIDAGEDPGRIAWIDPSFTVGDLGTSWRMVVSNTPVGHFLKFCEEVRSFEFAARPAPFPIEKLAPELSCPLVLVAEPLKWITDRVKPRVAAMVDRVVGLGRDGEIWRVTLASTIRLHARKVILAIGAEPKRLRFAGLDEIPLAVALNPSRLRREVQPSDHVAVFGDAQSARSVLENLLTLGVGTVTHFHHSTSTVARHLRDLDLSTIRSLPFNAQTLLSTIPHCTKAIYAVGFERRSIEIDGLPSDYSYDPETGVIAPGVFGLGIAFPQILHHELGRAEYRVASIWPVMRHLQRCLPLWLGPSGYRR